jgi:hypothetical protein
MLTDRVGSTVDYTDGDVVWRAERLADGFQFRLVGTPNAERVNAQPWIDSPLPFDA